MEGGAKLTEVQAGRHLDHGLILDDGLLAGYTEGRQVRETPPVGDALVEIDSSIEGEVGTSIEGS